MPKWIRDLPPTDFPDNPKYSYTPTRDPKECRHERGWRTIHCDSDMDIVRCDLCGERRRVACNFDEDVA